MEQKTTDFLIKYRYLLSALVLLLSFYLISGAKNLYFESDYKIFFSDDNEILLAHEAHQREYTKTDTLLFLIRPKGGDVFNAEFLSVLKDLTEEGWDVPFAIRVDSITNYQHSWAEGDELIVRDLVDDLDALDKTELERIRDVALSEKQLFKRFISRSGDAVAVAVQLDLPEIDLQVSEEEISAQRVERDNSFAEVVDFGTEIKHRLEAQYDGMEVHLTGVPIINNTFNSSAINDMTTIVPVMYAVILISLSILMRSVGAVVGAVVVIGLATASSLGAAGWIGFALNSINATTPTIILTIAVCDSVHLLVIYLRQLGLGDDPVKAMRESLLVNLQPIILTSVTTAVGFATLNFSESPPFQQLGTISAFGVMYAMILTLCLLPALGILLVRKRKPVSEKNVRLEVFSNFVIKNRKGVFIGVLVVMALLLMQIPRNQINDDPIEYFKEGVPYRDASDFAQQYLPGVKDLNFSVSCQLEGCINSPEYLQKLEEFTVWLEHQPRVEFVSSYADVIKRLNRNMHGDDPSYYRIPESVELSAQYHLLYELSLPFGLDLNNQINFDKSATKISLVVRKSNTRDLIDLEISAQQWFEDNYPELQSRGASVDLMFAVLGEDNVKGLSIGALLALVGVTLTILIALRSFKYTLISALPNALPAAMALGVWGMVVGEVNMGVAAVFSVTLGIVVDDTVHFISKYRRAREKNNLSPEAAINYAFNNVGVALLVTTIVLSFGFGLLAFSSFNLNAYMGILTAITVTIALIFDFLILPPLLLMFEGKETQEEGT